MEEVRYLVDTSALIRLLRNPELSREWRREITDGSIATCAITEIELLYTAKSRADRDRQESLIRETFGWVVMPDRVFKEAREVQEALTDKGTHRSAGPVDLLTAATAEQHGLTLLHYDADFLQVAEVTGQQTRWVAEAGTID
ncbi:PIN domain nuclease [Actinoplanes sp. NBC_00393]|uniref:PIN domain nuclease n=1 Tax=Actinoplanes sp. NBC_00393 TaxID=2975953 RepID=UPI002E1FB85C